MRPFSAIYYMKENKAKTAISVFLIALTAGLFLLGNFIQSVPQSFATDLAYDDRFILISATSVDENFEEYSALLDDVKNDPRLHALERSARGFSALQYRTALGLMVGGISVVCNSAEDMETLFGHLGIACDCSGLRDHSLVISKDFANNRGIKLGDTLDRSFDSALSEIYTVDALIDSNSYTCFYLVEDNDRLLRMYVYSDKMQGNELRDYVTELAGDKKVQIARSMREQILPQFDMFYIIFYTVAFFISVIMAVTVNSVLTGQYLKRTYEFGVYRAIGRSRRELFLKCAAEILCMDLLAVLIGLAVEFVVSYLLNELVFHPKGIYLPYASAAAVLGYALCNSLIVIPLVLSKGRMCCKADVTEF